CHRTPREYAYLPRSPPSTRRSSVLAKVQIAESRTSIAHEGGLRRQVVTANPPPDQAEKFTRAARETVGQVKLPPGVYLQYSGTADRKSTRLNSSHVKNSYAVFSLKK